MGDEEEEEFGDSFEPEEASAEASAEQEQSGSHGDSPSKSRGESSYGASDALTVSAHRSDEDSYAREAAVAEAAAGEDEPVTVTIIGAMGLRDADGGGGSDPYVICEIEGQPGSIFAGNRLITPAVQDAMDLCWNFTGKLSGFRIGDSLVFTVMDEDEGSEHEPLGRGVVTADKLQAGASFRGEIALSGRGAGDGSPILGLQVDVPSGLPRRAASELAPAAGLPTAEPAAAGVQAEDDSYEDDAEEASGDSGKVATTPASQSGAKLDQTYEDTYEDDAEDEASGDAGKSSETPSSKVGVPGGEQSYDSGAGSSSQEPEPISVTVIGAMGLRDADAGEGSDPYVIVEVEGRPGTRIVTPSVQNAMDLCWNFTGALKGYRLGDNLVFRVMDADEGGEDDALGKAVLSADKLQAGASFRGELSLTGRGAGDNSPLLGIQVDVPAGVARRAEDRADTSSSQEVSRDQGSTSSGAEAPGGAGAAGGEAAVSPQLSLPVEPRLSSQDDSKRGSVRFVAEDSGEEDGEAAGTPTQRRRGRLSSKESTPHPSQSRTAARIGFIEEPSDQDDEEPAEPLSITVVGAMGLRNADSDGAADPYCTVEIQGRPGSRLVSHVVKDTTDLVWNWTTQIKGFRLGDSLLFKIFDKDEDSQDDPLGEAVLNGEEIKPGDLYLVEMALAGRGAGDGKPLLGVKVQCPVGLPSRTKSDEDSRPAMGRMVSECHLGSDSESGSDEEESSGEDLPPPPVPQERRPSAIRFQGALPPRVECADEGVTSGADGHQVGTGWRRPSQLSTPRLRLDLAAAAQAPGQGRRPSLVQFTETTSPLAGVDAEKEPHVETRRKSMDSTPRFDPAVLAAGFGGAGEDDDEDEEDEEEEAAADKLEESEEQVVIEDVVDVGVAEPSKVEQVDILDEPWPLDGTQPQGAAGVALLKSPLTRASSSPGLSSSPSRPRRRPIKPVKTSAKSSFDRKAQKWDDRFHLLEKGGQNEQKPRQMRTYFSRPASLPELRQEFVKRGREADAKRLEGVGREEERVFRPTGPITADAEEPVIPGRHRIGGLSPSEDGSAPAPWNDRWSNGVALYNELLHPLHRAGFARRSVFEVSPSQKWRRFNHVEVATGVWRRAQHGQPRFPPLGV